MTETMRDYAKRVRRWSDTRLDNAIEDETGHAYETGDTSKLRVLEREAKRRDEPQNVRGAWG